MKKIILIVIILLLLFSSYLTYLELERARYAKVLDSRWVKEEVISLNDIGSTDTLEVMPLVNWYSISEELMTEAGVSYLIKTNDHTILFDMGFNKQKQTTSPLMNNMKVLGIAPEEIDSIFLSHIHRDHIGGVEAEKNKTVNTETAGIPFGSKPLYAPRGLKEHKNVVLIDKPKKLLNSIASAGTIGRSLLVGKIEEQALVVNLTGKGLVLFVGCGHQTMPKLIERVQAVFDEPIYAIIGDLHYPYPSGRLEMMGLDVQRRFASGNGLFNPIELSDIKKDIELLNGRLQVLAMGSHDTHDFVLNLFEEEFSGRFEKVIVGKSIKL